MAIITPTNGRVVWFTPGPEFSGVQHSKDMPLAAIVCHVWGDRMVNLDVIDSNGNRWPVTSVDLVQTPEDLAAVQAAGRYAEWMPYQRGQAQKTGWMLDGIGQNVEQLERHVAELQSAEAGS